MSGLDALSPLLAGWSRSDAVMRLRDGNTFTQEVLRHPGGHFAVGYWAESATNEGQGAVARLCLMPAGVKVADFELLSWGHGVYLGMVAQRIVWCVEELLALPVDWQGVGVGAVPIRRSLQRQLEGVLIAHGAQFDFAVRAGVEVH